MPKAAAALVLAALALCLPGSAEAQYFGRNKVKYEAFSFHEYDTEHFTVYHYPEGAGAAGDSAQMLERWYARYTDLLEYELPQSQKVVLYDNMADFRQTNVIFGLISPATQGVTEGLADRVVLPLTGIYHENDHVLGHELVHAFQFVRIRATSFGYQRVQPPLWFMEGMAELLPRGRVDSLTAMWMRDAVLYEDIPTLRQMSRRPDEYFPYRYGHAVWAYIVGTYGEDVVVPFFDAVVNRGVSSGVRSELNIRSSEFSEQWQDALRKAYLPEVLDRTRPEEVGTRLSTGSEINLGPVVSPDGTMFAFFARRNPFTLDLYLADAGTGRIIRRIGRSDRDAHYDALRFTESAGSWSPDSKTFAFVVFQTGDNAIALVDVETGDTIRTIKPEGVPGIIDVAWSPDGRTLVFSGIRGGISDLYLLDLETEEVVRLTEDKHAQFQPVWSPDGRVLAFVTDQGAYTDYEQLVFESMNIGFMEIPEEPGWKVAGVGEAVGGHSDTGDVKTVGDHSDNGDVKAVGGHSDNGDGGGAHGERMEINILSLKDGGRHISPQFSPDGTGLYFVGEFDGYSDLYRYSFGEAQTYRITRIATGISGLSELSPCLSVSSGTGRVLFTVYGQHSYWIHALNAEETSGTRVDPGRLDPGTSIVLPAAGGEREPPAAPGEGARPIPEESAFELEPYDPGLMLLGVGQTGIGVTFSPFGNRLTAPVSFLFGDVLGNRLLDVTAQISSEFETLGGRVAYINQRRRLNWSVSLAHIPIEEFSIVETDDGTGTDENVLREITFVDQASFLAQYPYSTNRRLEFGVAYERHTFRDTGDLLIIEDGSLVERVETDVDAPDPLNLFPVTLAYVGDYADFGFTSPLRGRRYRLEVQPVFGSLNYLAALADYRQYAYVAPWLSFGFRGVFLGRFFEDGESDLLEPFNVGNPYYVRGYDPFSFSSDECDGNPGTDCPEFDRLTGSRAAVFNAEVRIPLLGSEELGLISFPFLPLDLIGFLDAGLAWTTAEEPVLELTESSDQRIPVISAGGAVRIGLGGAVALEIFAAYPFQRPEADLQWGLLIRPGW